MKSDEARIDELLAAALRGDATRWPAEGNAPTVIERIAYHGIAGLLNERTSALVDWPEAVIGYLRDQAIALAMWELRHKEVLSELLGGFANAGVVALLLKGTAVAYDLYPRPATRARGDTDVLVAVGDLFAARSVLQRLGYHRATLEDGMADDLALQEVWDIASGEGTSHHIDLHWQLLNAPALAGLLQFEECVADQLPLSRLHPSAQTMSRQLTLLHTCIHRAMHLTTPYRVGGVTYYGGDRLIWARDIDFLASSLNQREWHRFTRAAIGQGVASVCSGGLKLAQRRLHSKIPGHVLASLDAVPRERASVYLLGSGQARRAWADFKAIRGWRRKITYGIARGLPSTSFIRAKYPELAGRPLALLYLRRLIDFVRPRPERSGG